MTEQLTQLVNSSQNFRFLAKPALLLAGDLAAAEIYVDSDPDAAMVKARRFGENLVKSLLRQAGFPDKCTFDQGIKKLAGAGRLPDRIQHLLYEVKNDGNKAAHGYLQDRQRAAAVVESCFELAVWWHLMQTGRAVNHAYTPVSPGRSESVRDLLAGVEAQLTKLQSTVDASLVAASTAAQRPEARIVIGPAAPDPYHWRGGSIVTCGPTAYLVHEPVDQVAADGSWTLLQADGHSHDFRAEPIRLRGVVMAPGSTTARSIVDGLTAQASFLRSADHRKGLPQVRAHHRDGRLHTLVLSRPRGSTWNETFGAGHRPLDPLILPLALDVLAAVAGALAELHRSGAAHRALDGEAVRIAAAGRQGFLRDLGSAWWPPMPADGSQYRAPEQAAMARGRTGPPTDVYQLAALLHHTCGAVRPGVGHVAPLSMFVPGVPAPLDALLARALDPDPARRPDMAAVAAGLRTGRQQLAMGAAGDR